MSDLSASLTTWFSERPQWLQSEATQHVKGSSACSGVNEQTTIVTVPETSLGPTYSITLRDSITQECGVESRERIRRFQPF